jgi:uncharacterized phiE125 gp8 family phage protein
MALTLVAAPAREPVTLQQAKDHLRVDAAVDDSVIDPLIKTARQHIEDFSHRALITQTWDLFLDEFPGIILMPKPPLQSVTQIQYLDTAGVKQTLASTEYKVDVTRHPGRIVPAWGKSWPLTRNEINAVEIRFVAGHGDNPPDLPSPIIQTLLLIVAHLYENREATTNGSKSNELPLGARDLLMPYRNVRL